MVKRCREEKNCDSCILSSHIQVAWSHYAKTVNYHHQMGGSCSALLELKAVIAWLKKIGSRYKGSTKQQMMQMQMVLYKNQTKLLICMAA